MPPRPGLEPDDLVTPTAAAALLRRPASTIRTWIERYGIQPLGRPPGSRWDVYDFRELAAVDARMRRKAALPAAA